MEDNFGTSPEGFAGKSEYMKAPKRSASGDTGGVADLVSTILDSVRKRGDEAVREFSQRFDKINLEQFEVSRADRESAVAQMDAQDEGGRLSLRSITSVDLPMRSLRPFVRSKLKSCRGFI